MYVRPEIDGEVTTFGVTGRLWRDSLVMYDRATRSLWSQLLGRAVAGPLAGRELEALPAEVTTWSAWKRRHPDTLLLKKPPREALEDTRRRGSSYGPYHADPSQIGVRGTTNPDDRLPGKALVYGIRADDLTAALPFALLEKAPVLNAEVSGRPIVAFSPAGEAAAMVYARRVGDRVLRFEQVEGTGERLTARDLESGSTWSWETGECLQGALEGSSLERIPGTTVYWGIWAQFHPDTDVVTSGF